MNDDVLISLIGLCLNEDDQAVQNSGKIVITIRRVDKNGQTITKDLLADYCRYVVSPLSGHRYLVAGSGPGLATAYHVKPTTKYNRKWTFKLRDFYAPVFIDELYDFETARVRQVQPKYGKIMTIKAENVVNIARPST